MTARPAPERLSLPALLSIFAALAISSAPIVALHWLAGGQ